MGNIFQDRTSRLALVMALSSGTIILTIISLSLGIHEIFPYLYIIPIILISYLYPSRGVIASLVLGCIYMGLVYFFGLFDLTLITISTAWFYVIVSVGVVMSSLSEGLRREERKYLGIFENSQSALFTLDRSSLQIVEANQECARMLDYDVAGLVGKPVSLIWPDEGERNYVFSRISDRFPPGENEARLITRQGQMRWALIAAALTPEGRVVVSATDITERKHIEEALMDSEIKFRTIVERSLAGVFVVQEGTFRYVNPRYGEIHGYRPAEMIDQMGPRNLVREEDWEPIASSLDDAARRPGIIHLHYREVTREGHEIFVEVLASHTSYHGKPAIMGTLLDVTDQRRTEYALRQANSKLNLLSSITRHDILNHLTAIQGYMGLAMETNTDASVDTFLRNASQVTGKTQTLLQFSRDYQSMGVQDPEWQPLTEVVLRSLPLISSPKLSVQLRLEGVEIYADKLQEKVFYNLLDNTLRHGDHATEVRLTFREEERGLVLLYEDNGKGIPEFEKSLIFKRGYGKNTGFGLFLIREILSLTGITIQETGEAGKGVRFEIVVPKGNYRIRSMDALPVAERIGV